VVASGEVFQLHPPPPPPEADADAESDEPKPSLDCDLGSNPGAWFGHETVGSRWQSLVPECPIRNLIAEHRKQDCEEEPPSLEELAEGGEDKGGKQQADFIILIGDSIDYLALHYYCQYIDGNLSTVADGLHPPAQIGNRDMVAHMLHVCTASCKRLVVGFIFIPGVATKGVLHMAHKFYYPQRISAAWAEWSTHYKLPPPDLVVMNANLWDIGRLNEADSPQADKDLFKMPQLPVSALHRWQRNAGAMVRLCRAVFGEDAGYVWHTVVVGRHESRNGLMTMTQIGKRSFVVEMNAAGRALAKKEGLMLLDVEAMVQSFHNTSYLADFHHPSQQVQLEMMNVLINILQQRKLQIAARDRVARDSVS